MDSIPSDFPRELDGARVLYVARTKKDEYTFYVDTGEKRPIIYYAIVQYDSETDFYTFSVGEDYQVIGDLNHDSLDEAFRQAEFSGSLTTSEWTAIG